MKLKLIAIALASLAVTTLVHAAEPVVAASPEAQKKMLESSDPQLAANKKLVWDMYRKVVNGGHTEEADKYFTEGYIQHNPNVVSGRDALVKYIKQTRPAVAIQPAVNFPVIAIMAEGDLVLISSVTYADDPMKPGTQYASTHFDLYRIENGKIAEHWDHVPKDPKAQHFNPNTETIKKKP